LPIQEFPQSSPNLTAASQNLYELIESNTMLTYPAADLRLAISRAVAIETPRGWKIGKDKQTHKIDVVVALAMAAYAAVKDGGTYYDLDGFLGLRDEASTFEERVLAANREHNRGLAAQIAAYSGGRWFG
jgi:phage terminase large subunit-like protein